VATSIVTCPNSGRRNRVPAAGDGNPRCGNCHLSLPWLTDADDTDFAEIAERSARTVLVDFWATWCGPCRMVSPTLETLASETADQLKLVKVDIDRSPALAQRFQIQSVPTLLVMRDGQVVARQSGAAPAAVLRGWVQDAIKQSERSFNDRVKPPLAF
jgi:thioredoxin 2